MFYNRTYFDKCATIVKGSKLNTGLNPVSDLLYGRNNSRFLLYFNHERIKRMVEDKVFPDISKLKHYLSITNASSLDMSELHKVYGSQVDGYEKKRATSFDLIFFLIPKDWDNGKGFDYSRSFFDREFYDKNDYRIRNYISEDGVTWYKPRNGYKWKEETSYQKTQDDQITFSIKADKKTISHTGDTVTITYTSFCNGMEQLRNINFKFLSPLLNKEVIVGKPIYYSKSGNICYTEEEIAKYAKYAKLTVKFPENDTDTVKKYSFVLECDILDQKYQSNQYRIIQNAASTITVPICDDGIYSTKTLENELNKFELGQESIIVGKQHFDIGCENIKVDISGIFNKFITGDIENHGIAIAFAPTYEYEQSESENYVGLFTNRTNSFFEPFVETIYEDSIEDDRQNFVLGRKNKLYLYTNIGGDLVNLDNLPSCSVDGVSYPVKQASKGIYYTEIELSDSEFTSPTMLYDVWSDLNYLGRPLNPVEMEFTTYPTQMFYKLGYQTPEKGAFTPTVYGINDNEEVKAGDVRKLCFVFKKDYTKNTAVMINDVEMRLYVMDGTAQVTVIPYIKTNRAFNDVYFLIDTGMLIPNTYHLDVRVKYGMEMIEHHDVLKFKVVNELNNRYV